MVEINPEYGIVAFFEGLLQIEWVIFGLLGPRSRETKDALLYKPMPFLKMEVIHSPGATSFNQQGRSGAVDHFLTFNSYFSLARRTHFFRHLERW